MWVYKLEIVLVRLHLTSFCIWEFLTLILRVNEFEFVFMITVHNTYKFDKFTCLETTPGAIAINAG